MQIGIENRLIDANLNRLREGIRVVEDIARYIFDDFALASRLKSLRHRARVGDSIFVESLLNKRDVANDILKTSTQSEQKRDNLSDIITANFKRSEESARVLEEIFKLDSTHLVESIDNNKNTCEIFKSIRYELYDVELAFLEVVKKHNEKMTLNQREFD